MDKTLANAMFLLGAVSAWQHSELPDWIADFEEMSEHSELALELAMDGKTFKGPIAIVKMNKYVNDLKLEMAPVLAR